MTIVRVTKTYKIILKSNEIKIPYGIFLPGFLISPPTAATFVTPIYETKTNAAVVRAYRVVLDEMLHEVVEKLNRVEPKHD